MDLFVESLPMAASRLKDCIVRGLGPLGCDFVLIVVFFIIITGKKAVTSK